MKKILHHFVHTTQEINGNGTTSEFLLPDVIDNKPMFIGLTSGKKYDRATIVATSRAWDENDLFKLLKKVRNVGFFGNSKKKLFLKRYIEQIIEIRKKHSDSVVTLDRDLNLIRVDSFSDFMNKKSPKLLQESDDKKEAYSNLAKICLHERDYVKFNTIINNLKNYDDHWKYQSTFRFLLNQLDRQSIHLFLSFDWKYEITDFHEFLKMVINKNFNQKIELPSLMIYQAHTTISKDGFLNNYKTALNQSNFDMSFIDDNSDQYLIVIHKLADTKKVSELISKLDL